MASNPSNQYQGQAIIQTFKKGKMLGILRNAEHCIN
jgi:hypothetical protein